MYNTIEVLHFLSLALSSFTSEGRCIAISQFFQIILLSLKNQPSKPKSNNSIFAKVGKKINFLYTK
jgi:hypothetical protein